MTQMRTVAVCASNKCLQTSVTPLKGNDWALRTAAQGQSTHLDRNDAQEAEEVPDSDTAVDDGRCVGSLSLKRAFMLAPEHLEDLLKAEVTQPGFSALPFRYIEASKVLLDA
jgi:hypothetical protein